MELLKESIRHSLYNLIYDLGEITGNCEDLFVDYYFLIRDASKGESFTYYWAFNGRFTQLSAYFGQYMTHRIEFDGNEFRLTKIR